MWERDKLVDIACDNLLVRTNTDQVIIPVNCDDSDSDIDGLHSSDDDSEDDNNF